MIAVSIILASILILNGFAAGVVAILYHWRGHTKVGQRALIGGMSSGIASLLLFLGPVLLDAIGGTEETLIMLLALTVVAVAGGVVSIPGAILMSRKIGSATLVDPDTFA